MYVFKVIIDTFENQILITMSYEVDRDNDSYVTLYFTLYSNLDIAIMCVHLNRSSPFKCFQIDFIFQKYGLKLSKLFI